MPSELGQIINQPISDIGRRRAINFLKSLPDAEARSSVVHEAILTTESLMFSPEWSSFFSGLLL